MLAGQPTPGPLSHVTVRRTPSARNRFRPAHSADPRRGETPPPPAHRNLRSTSGAQDGAGLRSAFPSELPSEGTALPGDYRRAPDRCHEPPGPIEQAAARSGERPKTSPGRMPDDTALTDCPMTPPGWLARQGCRQPSGVAGDQPAAGAIRLPKSPPMRGLGLAALATGVPWPGRSLLGCSDVRCLGAFFALA